MKWIVNWDKFQAIILNKKFQGLKVQRLHKLIIENNEIKVKNSIKILGINTDDQLKFNKHILTLCSKAVIHLNALSRLQKYMPEKEVIINSFISSNFSYFMLCYVMLCILYLKLTHKNTLQKTNEYRLIDATLTPGDQMWSLAVVAAAAATTYWDNNHNNNKKTQFKYENSTKGSKLHFNDLQYIYVCIYASYICYS